MKNEERQTSAFKAQMYIDDTGVENIDIIAKWAFFLCIIVFVSIFLMLGVVVLSAASIASNFAEIPFFRHGSPQFYIIGFYLLLAIFYFIPTYHLFNFSRNARKATNNQDDELLSKALSDLKSSFKTIGIFTIIVLVIYAITITALFAAVML